MIVSVVLTNWDLLAVGMVVILTVVLGFIVFFEQPRSRTHSSFLYFALLTALWGIFNYTSYRVNEVTLAFWLLRLTVFSVSWQTASFLFFALTFPNKKLIVSRYLQTGLLALTSVVSILTLTPLVFTRVAILSPTGRIASVVNGPAIPLFGFVTVGFVVAGIIILLRKIWRAEPVQWKSYRLIVFGLLMMFALIITSNLLLPVIWNNAEYIPFGILFVFPFIILTSLAIVRGNLFNVRVVSAEGFILGLLILNLVQLVQSQTTSEIIVRSIVVVSTLAIGVLLIRSVLREVEQREKLEVLSLQLAEANERLEELDKLKSEFVSMAGHQLRAPLTVIKGYTSLILDGTIDTVSEKVKDALEKVMFSTEQLIKLVSSLLDLSRIESGKIKYEFAEHDFVHVVEEVMDKFKSSAAKKGVEIVFENKFGPALFNFDDDKIREAIVNYIDNAVKYSKSGKVYVGLESMEGPDGGWVRFEVKDNGLGIKAEDISKLFGKFSRTEEAKVSDPNGMGIGLYFVKRVVQDHGGNVGAFSNGIGKGSTFWIELPTQKRGS